QVAAEASEAAVTDLSASTFDSTKARRQSVVILKRFLRHRLAMISLGVFIALVLFAFIGGALWKYSYTFEDTTGGGRYLAPSIDHPFGTDALAADSLAQVLRGTQFSVIIAFVVAFLSTAIGVVLGSLAGYFRGWVDSVFSRFTDLVLVIPALVLVGVLARNSGSATSGSGGNWYIIALFLGLTGWTSVYRVIRGMTLSLREKEFVEAARALGGGVGRLVFRHILPNTLDVIIVNATIAVSQAVLAEAALSFIGLGVHPPNTSLGLLINVNDLEITLHPWLFWFPFVFIVLISLCANFIGDGLRDAFDPRQKRVRA
ncbi:MAG TPA: ABC transporter permease, partial [Pseudonocardiaceae bacterium]|nr:ABC transporter permease [Pseudonocardiaceae bacterium]